MHAARHSAGQDPDRLSAPSKVIQAFGNAAQTTTTIARNAFGNPTAITPLTNRDGRLRLSPTQV
jgi:hypothetical protein